MVEKCHKVVQGKCKKHITQHPLCARNMSVEWAGKIWALLQRICTRSIFVDLKAGGATANGAHCTASCCTNTEARTTTHCGSDWNRTTKGEQSSWKPCRCSNSATH